MGKGVHLGAILVGCALIAGLLAGCGGSTGRSVNKRLVIATEPPVSGTDAAGGLPTQYGADLAIMQNTQRAAGTRLASST